MRITRSAISGLLVFCSLMPAGDVHADCVRLQDEFGAAAIAEAMRDMKLHSEALPLGVPASYDWRARGRVGLKQLTDDYHHIIPWAHVFSSLNNKDEESQIEVKSFRMFVLSSSGQKWKEIFDDDAIEGALFDPTYAQNASVPASIGIQVGKSSATIKRGFSFHFWPRRGRRKIVASDIAGVFVTVDARTPGLDDHFLIGVGGDYWKDQKPWNNFATNADIGISRMKFLKTNFRAYYMTTVSEPTLFSRCIDEKRGGENNE